MINSVNPFKKHKYDQNYTCHQSYTAVKKLHFLILPGAQSKGNTFIKTTNNSLKSILLNNRKPNVTHTGGKFG